MDSVKISNAARGQKKYKMKQVISYNSLTPPKLTDKRSTINTVNRLMKKYGYDDTYDVDECSYLKNQRVEFMNKAAKYVSDGKTFSKKQTRFDKMKKKE